MQLLLVYVQLRLDDAASLLSYTENVEAGTESVRVERVYPPGSIDLTNLTETLI